MNASTMKNIKEASIYSNETIVKIRQKLKDKFGDRDDVCAIVVGSFARREANAQSDLDFYILHSATAKARDVSDDICQVVKSIAEEFGIRMPSGDGAFGVCVPSESIADRIGGSDDDNECLTRRMLFLLESDWLFGEHFYRDTFDKLIKRYIKDAITEHQLCRFLLNDLIRYWRTICVDFDHKTGSSKKSWGDRNIKLLFSRKMLYFSGIVAVAETAQRTPSSKRDILIKLLRMPPLDRISYICGDASVVRAYRFYDGFLEKLADADFRKLLVSTGEDHQSQDEIFRDLKNNGHHFSWELANLLRLTYDVMHPIHHALIF